MIKAEFIEKHQIRSNFVVTAEFVSDLDKLILYYSASEEVTWWLSLTEVGKRRILEKFRGEDEVDLSTVSIDELEQIKIWAKKEK